MTTKLFGQRPSGVLHRHDEAVQFVSGRLLDTLHSGGGMEMPVRRKVVSLQSRLGEIELLLRRAAWPGVSDVDALALAEKVQGGEPMKGNARARAAWGLVLAVGCLRELLRAPLPNAGAVASLAVEIGMGTMAVLGKDADLMKIVEAMGAKVQRIDKQTTPKAFEDNYNRTLHNRDPRNKRPGPKPKYSKQERREAVDAMRALLKNGLADSVTDAVAKVQKDKGLYGRDCGYWRDEYYRLTRKPKKKPRT